MSDKKLILSRLLIFMILMVLLDQGIGAFLKHFYFVKKNGPDYRTNYVINHTRADVLIFGSSRAVYHYNTNLLQDSLKLSFFNAGRDLSYILYHYALLEGVLERYSPKLIILDTRPNEFQQFKYRENYDRLNVLLPYYDSHPEIRNICLLRSKFERYKLLSKIYPYNSLILPELVELLPIARYKKDDSENGYIAKYGHLNPNQPKYSYDVPNNIIDTVATTYYKKFIALCKARKIKLIIAYSPLYQNIDTAKNSNVVFVKQVCRQNNLPFINYLDNSEFNNPLYFYDGLHLNREGSTAYTNSIIGKIREVLNSN